MSREHLEYVVENLSLGTASPALLSTFGIPEQQVISIDRAFKFDAESSYCPVSDIPEFLTPVKCGVHMAEDKAYIIGDNGQCAFMFRLTRKA